MATIYYRDRDCDRQAGVEDPFPVRLDEKPGIGLPPVAGRTHTVLVRLPPMAGSYADGDAFGPLMQLSDVFRPVRCSGLVMGAFLIDASDQGIQVDVPLFIQPFTVTADSSAFAPSDADVVFCRGVFQINTFSNWGNNQFGQSANAPWPIVGTSPHLWTQLVIRGGPTIAAGSEPWLGLVVLPD